MEVRTVEHKRDTVVDVLIELLFVQPVTLLGELRSVLRQLLHLGIVVDLKMLSSQDLPVEIRVLYFVSAEVVELRRRGLHQKEEQKGVWKRSSNHSMSEGNPVSWLTGSWVNSLISQRSHWSISSFDHARIRHASLANSLLTS